METLREIHRIPIGDVHRCINQSGLINPIQKAYSAPIVLYTVLDAIGPMTVLSMVDRSLLQDVFIRGVNKFLAGELDGPVVVALDLLDINRISDIIFGYKPQLEDFQRVDILSVLDLISARVISGRLFQDVILNELASFLRSSITLLGFNTVSEALQPDLLQELLILLRDVYTSDNIRQNPNPISALVSDQERRRIHGIYLRFTDCINEIVPVTETDVVMGI